ncbi:hypothetical protein BPOR_0031g00200 [Botrytis porri]|uniref:Uncharacterized protein n=1 Tax=Botrytis porri TaxID=87229 RepID=A0A4Z1L3H4_9HELO|nr:hypothetical protein BPOR_0031g00200 [Botrytis porri]
MHNFDGESCITIEGAQILVSVFCPSTQGTVEPIITKASQVVNTNFSKYGSSRDKREVSTDGAAVDTGSFMCGDHHEKREASKVVNTSPSKCGDKATQVAGN